MTRSRATKRPLWAQLRVGKERDEVEGVKGEGRGERTGRKGGEEKREGGEMKEGGEDGKTAFPSSAALVGDAIYAVL
eukprot:297920-Chlamydomonas_euryale.AAC.3